jgi:nucleoside-diphosphate-sugar epimerase
MHVSKQYAKDYVSVEDVASAICRLSLSSNLKHNIYNIATGSNVSSQKIADKIKVYTDCEIIWHDLDVANEEKFPITNIKRITKDIDFTPSSVLDDLPLMISEFKKVLTPVSN